MKDAEILSNMDPREVEFLEALCAKYQEHVRHAGSDEKARLKSENMVQTICRLWPEHGDALKKAYVMAKSDGDDPFTKAMRGEHSN